MTSARFSLSAQELNRKCTENERLFMECEKYNAGQWYNALLTDIPKDNKYNITSRLTQFVFSLLAHASDHRRLLSRQVAQTLLQCPGPRTLRRLSRGKMPNGE